MSSPSNYYPDLDTTNVLEELPKRIERVLQLAEFCRQEINRVRNTALAFRLPVSRELLASLSHLQVDLAHASVEIGYFTGRSPEEMRALLDLIEHPFKLITNEGRS